MHGRQDSIKETTCAMPGYNRTTTGRRRKRRKRRKRKRARRAPQRAKPRQEKRSAKRAAVAAEKIDFECRVISVVAAQTYILTLKDSSGTDPVRRFWLKSSDFRHLRY